MGLLVRRKDFNLIALGEKPIWGGVGSEDGYARVFQTDMQNKLKKV